MANQVAIIVKILCGSFYVNGVRFTGEKTQFLCMFCGNYYTNPVKHAMLHCCETQLARTKLWERITDFFPVEFVANINSLDEDNLMQTIFGNMQFMQGHDNNQVHIIIAESISQIITITSYIDIYLDSETIH
ncbi:Hypothetical predicted protein [Paramuricea clavata]|uniref:Uncharacterized protein n=1 Tax=Paramuricea clavata TaxID=317549 RepID=A0A7D9J7S6_PARCT|nr:Hypothetical predicted protein [Paramuricea clavata]